MFNLLMNELLYFVRDQKRPDGCILWKVICGDRTLSQMRDLIKNSSPTKPHKIPHHLGNKTSNFAAAIQAKASNVVKGKMNCRSPMMTTFYGLSGMKREGVVLVMVKRVSKN